MSPFELFVALRYLKAKRKQAVVSVITVISIIGVAAGVMALVVALAVNNGFRGTLQRNLLGATAHVTVLEKEPGYGIEKWRDLSGALQRLPHVTGAAPVLYGEVFLSAPLRSGGAVLKGIQTGSELPVSDFLRRLKAGSLTGLNEGSGLPGIILGSRLADKIGMRMGDVVTVISPQGTMTPLGMKPSYHRFRVAGIFETGFADLDSAWAYTSLKAAQRALSLEDVVNAIEVKTDDIQRAGEVAQAADKVVGPKLAATTWMEQNRQIFNALRMEKAVTVITIGLIELVAALNILIALVMLVMEKNRDIAILMSMGARLDQIRRIFVYQGLMIGVVGTAIGLAVGHTLCFLADRHRWVRLDEEIYQLSFVPFEPRWPDSLWVAGAAILVSYLATIYPARNAATISPVEALRYE